MRKHLSLVALLTGMLIVLAASEPLLARPGLGGAGGGGGGRAGGGGGGRPAGGGGRPAGGGGMARPMPAARPSMPASRPSMGNVQSRPNVSRPANPGISHPSLGGGGISQPSRPQITRPSTGVSTRPSLPNQGIATRPSITPPSNLRPAIKPGGDFASRPGFDRPGINPPGIDRPGIDRPGINPPGIDRPGIDRPGIDRPGIDTRPVRPGIGDIAGRPGINRPETRPTRPDRPIIGGGNGNVIIGGGNNIIGGGNVRPGGDWWGQNHDWGWHPNHDWHDHWQDHCIHDHYQGWYHGCWGTGSYWYVPLAVGATYWGTSAWGYSASYSNPYYEEAPAQPYDYSQPVVVNNYVTADADGNTTSSQNTAQATASAEAAKLIDEALRLFKARDYAGATAQCDAALKKSPGDSVVHEVRALCLFAQGEYQGAAAALNALLAVAPGMDWTTMSSLYANNDEYTKQLRALEQHCRAKPTDAAAAFVLAYHYMVLDEKEAAASALETVVKQQPNDAVAQRLLDAVRPATAQPAATSTDPASTVQVNEFAAQPETDLVGTWKAVSGGTTIELAIDEQSKFTWKATPPGKAAVTLTGDMETSSNTLALKTKDQGTMAGTVKSGGADQFQFTLAGAPSTDKGLTFARVK